MPFNITPETISGKVRVRPPYKAEALSSRYVFLNLYNSEPNLGVPNTNMGVSPDPGGIRYALLSNNSYSSTLCAVSAWRVWAVDAPTIATYSVQKSIALGENAQPIRDNSLVYSNHPWGTNPYNSEAFVENSYNVYSLSGIYLFNSTTVGDPASATSFIVTDNGLVGINTDNPNERLTLQGNMSANGNIVITTNAYVSGNTFLGNAKSDITTIRGKLQIGDATTTEGIYFGNNNTNYDVNLYRGVANVLKTNDTFHCYALSALFDLRGSELYLTSSSVLSSFITPLTASGEFVVININGKNRALRLWDY